MIKFPVKDTLTVPWMSQREIPAVKAALSQWRRMRRDKDFTRATIGWLLAPAEGGEE